MPPAQARAIVQAIEIEIAGARDTLATRQDILILRQETRQDILSLRHEMTELRSELRQEMTELRAELRQEMTQLATDLRRDMSDLRHTFEPKLAAAVTQPQLYGALLGQMALLLGIAYFFVTHLQH